MGIVNVNDIFIIFTTYIIIIKTYKHFLCSFQNINYNSMMMRHNPERKHSKMAEFVYEVTDNTVEQL